MRSGDRQPLSAPQQGWSGFLTLISRGLAVLALIYSLGSLFIYGFLPGLLPWAFAMIGITNPAGGRIWPSFADLRWVTATSACGTRLQDLAAGISAGCDPYGRPPGLGYPPMAVEAARFLALRGEHTGLLGFSIGVAVVLILVLLTRRQVRPEWLANLLISLILLGFPVQLALERGNIDIVVFVLLSSLAAFSALKAPWAALPAAGFSGLAVAIKMYPLVGIIAWWLDSLSVWRRRPWLPLAVLVGLSAGFTSIWPWYQQSGDSAAQTLDREIGHGLVVPLITEQMTLLQSWPVAHIGAVQNPGQPIVALVLVLLAFALFRQQGLHHHWLSLLNERPQGFERDCQEALTRLLAMVWLGCYLLSGSFDYRMILALPALITCGALLGRNGGLSLWSRGLLALILLGVVYGWFAPFFPRPSLIRQLNLFCDLLLMPLFAGCLLALLPSPLPGWFGRDRSGLPAESDAPL